MTACLTSHVLDTARGGPAVGMRLELFSLENQTKSLLKSTSTNNDGRTDKPLLDAGNIEAGNYQIDFYVGEFFENCGISISQPKFLDIIPVEFGIADEKGHYHVPLLASPWSYSNYRGSSPANMPADNLLDKRPSDQRVALRRKDYQCVSPQLPAALPGTGAPGLTTHVLDMTRGCGAAGVQIDVFQIDGSQRTYLKSVKTDNEGRSEEWLIQSGEIQSGQYEFAFHIGDYFVARGAELPGIRYLDVVPVLLGLSPEEGHYHIPLLIAPWGYSTYRGS